MQPFAGVGPDVRLEVGLLESPVIAAKNWAGELQFLLVRGVREHVSRKIALSADDLVANRTLNRNWFASGCRHFVIVVERRERWL